MTTLTTSELTAARVADSTGESINTVGNDGGSITVITTKFGHVFVGAALGPGSAAASVASAKANFTAAQAYAVTRWATVADVPAGLTLDLVAPMTKAQYKAAPVPDVSAADMSLINGQASSNAEVAGAVAKYTTAYGTTYASVIDVSGDENARPTVAAEDQARNLAIGYEAYARRIYRIAAFAKLNPSVGYPV
jgi:hypothetical protein